MCTQKLDMCPKLSVIIPIYKVEGYLKRCVDSVIVQSYCNLEIILVDDGSPDNCPQMCDLYAEKDSRIKVIHKSNGGLSDARNKGIDSATGEYLVFIDSDDYIHVNMFKIMMGAILNTQSDIAVCNFEYVNEEGASLDKMNEDYPIKDILYSSNLIFYEEMARPRYCDWVVAWNKIYKKSIFQTLRYPVGIFNEDEYVANELYRNEYKVVGVSDVLYYYVQRSGSIMNTASKIKLADGVDALLKRSELWCEHNAHNAYTMLCYSMDRFSYLYEQQKKVLLTERYKNFKKNIRYIITKLWPKSLKLKSRLKLCAAFISPYWLWKIGTVIKK